MQNDCTLTDYAKSIRCQTKTIKNMKRGNIWYSDSPEIYSSLAYINSKSYSGKEANVTGSKGVRPAIVIYNIIL